MKKIFSIAALSLALATSATLATPAVYGQAISVNGGAISGTITDASGAVVPNAQVLITSTDTGYKKTVTTTSAGLYQVGPLNPGKYTITVTAPGFATLDVSTVVRTGTATSGSYQLGVGSSAETIQVSTGDLQINTEQAAVSDVLTREQIQGIPVNGRNFLDTLSVEPGVQLQNGESFDPTKAGYSAVSINGASGRTTRILLDGQDITDEFVGTTMYYIPQGAVNEVQLNRSNQDVSGEETSTGNVLVSSASGTNRIHGQAFYNFQDNRVGFATINGLANSKAPFQRNQYGGNVGLPLIKDKLFLFANSERVVQHSSTGSTVNGTIFPQILAAFPAYSTPYKETFSLGRLDWNGPFKGHYFARGMYDVNAISGNFNNGYSLYANRDNTYGFAFGADFVSGRFAHSFRGSYEKFHNLIGDTTSGNSSVYNGVPGIHFRYTAANLYSGPNINAPQQTFQSDKQLRYDGAWTKGAHNIRFGGSLNRILAGGFAAFYNASYETISATTLLNNANFVAGNNPSNLGCNGQVGAAACPSDPVNGYRLSRILIGNGQGYATEKQQFNQLGGNSSWRYAFYAVDSWKATPDLTVTMGIRYSVDTNRANQDLPQPTCADIDNSFVDTPSGCTSGSVKLFDLWVPGLGHQTQQPYFNLAPQLGLNYSPGSHKTAIRGSFGLFNENNIFNNQSNARSNLLKNGNFFNYDYIQSTKGDFFIPGKGSVDCFSGTSTFYSSASSPGGTCAGGGGAPLTDLILNRSFGQAIPVIQALKSQYQAASAVPQQNAGYVGNTLSATGLYAPFYRAPYSFQYSFGIQREISKGTIISADYIHNSTLHAPTSIDVNHDGAARTMYTPAVQHAIAATNASKGCGNSFSAAATACAVAAGAKISNYAANGLTSNTAYDGGYAPSYYGDTPNTGAAFPGLHPDLGTASMIFPGGRSGFDALQLVFKTQKAHPAPGLRSANFQVAYQYGQSVTSSGNGSDQFFSGYTPYNVDQPNLYMGPGSLDRRHQLNFGGSFLIKYGPRIGLLAHFYSARPSTLLLDSTTNSGAGQIFTTDLDGDGTVADLAPGTNPGAYMRQIKGKDLPNYITNFNTTKVGQITPAGQALVSAGYFTAAQLRTIGAAVQPIATIASGPAIQNPAFRVMDANASYPISLGRFREGLSLEPSVAMYNVFNFSNFGGVTSSTLSSTGAAGSVNGPNNQTTYNSQRTTRSSTFSQGSPRLTEFQLKLNF